MLNSGKLLEYGIVDAEDFEEWLESCKSDAVYDRCLSFFRSGGEIADVAEELGVSVALIYGAVNKVVLVYKCRSYGFYGYLSLRVRNAITRARYTEERLFNLYVNGEELPKIRGLGVVGIKELEQYFKLNMTRRNGIC